MAEFRTIANTLLTWGGGLTGIVGVGILARDFWKIYGPSKWNPERFNTPERRARRAEIRALMTKLNIRVSGDAPR